MSPLEDAIKHLTYIIKENYALASFLWAVRARTSACGRRQKASARSHPSPPPHMCCVERAQHSRLSLSLMCVISRAQWALMLEMRPAQTSERAGLQNRADNDEISQLPRDQKSRLDWTDLHAMRAGGRPAFLLGAHTERWRWRGLITTAWQLQWLGICQTTPP